MTRRTRGAARPQRDSDDIRDQEVARANKELAAYFKGQRTEREARAALKIVKAFVRDRERLDAASRRPLPGLGSSEAVPAKARKPKKTVRAEKPRRRARRQIRRERESGGLQESPAATSDVVDSTDD